MPHTYLRKSILYCFMKNHPGEILSNITLSPWSPCQKRRPWVNFLALFQTLYGSPWSPCQNATYISEKICSLLLVKDHPGEIFSTFILSPWSQCQKRRPWVNFLAHSQTLIVSLWSPCQEATYVFEKICSLKLVKDHPGEIFALLS